MSTFQEDHIVEEFVCHLAPSYWQYHLSCDEEAFHSRTTGQCGIWFNESTCYQWI